jgi:hypothetical protein
MVISIFAWMLGGHAGILYKLFLSRDISLRIPRSRSSSYIPPDIPSNQEECQEKRELSDFGQELPFFNSMPVAPD